MRFNEAQQEAVDFYQGPCLTLAVKFWFRQKLP